MYVICGVVFFCSYNFLVVSRLDRQTNFMVGFPIGAARSEALLEETKFWDGPTFSAGRWPTGSLACGYTLTPLLGSQPFGLRKICTKGLYYLSVLE